MNDEDDKTNLMSDFEIDEAETETPNLDVNTVEETDKEETKEADQAASDLMAATSDTSDIPTNWIEVKDGKFLCSECENVSAPETNTVDGTVVADTEKILADLVERPTKIVYGSCPVCGMEYLFKTKSGKLFMEPSDMLK